MLSGQARAKAFQDKISQDCPECDNRVLAIRINGFYAGSRDRIFLSSGAEAICYLNRSRIKHWSLKNVNKKIKVLVNNDWYIHNFRFTNPLVNYDKIGEIETSAAIICFNENTLGCLFNITNRYHDAIPILDNFIRRIMDF